MKRRFFIVGAAVVLAVCVGVGIAWVRGVVTELRGIADAYAKWDAGTLLIEHMETHEGKWPAGWEDLRECYGRLSGEGRKAEKPIWSASFEEIRSRIGIDWEADPGKLVSAQSDGAREPFRVVWALSGNSMVWSGAEPNQMILDYLKERLPPGAGAATTRPVQGVIGEHR